MVDIARLGLAVESGQVEHGTVALKALTGAAKGAEAANAGLAASTRASGATQKVATVATQAHTAALHAQAAAARLAGNTNRMLAFQLNDVVVSLASGMNPAMVALQQGSQIAQLGLGNVARSALSMARGFAPALAAVAALGVGVASLTTEINRNQKQQVAWTDVVVASWQLASKSVMRSLKPVFDTLGGWWDAVSPFIAEGINKTIGIFDFGVKAIGVVWNTLPGVIGESVWNVAQNTVNGVIFMVREVEATINGLIVKVNAMLGTTIGQLQMLPYVDLGPNPFGGGIGDLASGLAGAWNEAMGTNYLSLIGDRARQVALSGSEGDTKGTKKAIHDITDEFDGLMGKAYGVREAITGVFGDMGSVIGDSFRKGGNVALNVLDALLNKVGNVGESLMNAGLNGLLNMGINALTGALTGSAPGFSYGPSVFSDPWGGLRANGGPVEAGKAYIVGEERPELFVPRMSGTIVPSVPANGNAANQNAPIINIVVNADTFARGADIANAVRPVAREEARRAYLQMQRNPDR